jgi:hypothetical protein
VHSTVNLDHKQLAGEMLAKRSTSLYVCLSYQVLPRVGEKID